MPNSNTHPSGHHHCSIETKSPSPIAWTKDSWCHPALQKHRPDASASFHSNGVHRPAISCWELPKWKPGLRPLPRTSRQFSVWSVRPGHGLDQRFAIFNLRNIIAQSDDRGQILTIDGVYFTSEASSHVPGTAHEIALFAHTICAVPGTLCPKLELHPDR